MAETTDVNEEFVKQSERDHYPSERLPNDDKIRIRTAYDLLDEAMRESVPLFELVEWMMEKVRQQSVFNAMSSLEYLDSVYAFIEYVNREIHFLLEGKDNIDHAFYLKTREAVFNLLVLRAAQMMDHEDKGDFMVCLAHYLPDEFKPLPKASNSPRSIESFSLEPYGMILPIGSTVAFGNTRNHRVLFPGEESGEPDTNLEEPGAIIP